MRDDVGSEPESIRIYERENRVWAVASRKYTYDITLQITCNEQRKDAHTQALISKIQIQIDTIRVIQLIQSKENEKKKIPNYSIPTMHGMHRAHTVRTYYPNESMGKRKSSGSITCEQKMILWHQRHQCLREGTKKKMQWKLTPAPAFIRPFRHSQIW